MGKNRLLVDSDIFIGYLNHRQHREYLEGARWQIYYSVVAKKELLAKQGLSDRERKAILFLLRRYRQVTLTQAIAGRYAELRRLYPALEVRMLSSRPQLWSARCRCSQGTSGIFASL